MAFFTNYNGTTDARLVRVERLTWTLIYGGLLALVLGYFMQRAADGEGSTVMALGAVAAVLGVAMVFVRARMADKP